MNVVLRGFLPVMFVFLSVIFGEGMRRAGRTVADAGRRASDAIGRAREVFRERADEEIAALEAEPAEADAKVRVAPAPDLRIEVRERDGGEAREARDDRAAEAELAAEEEATAAARRGSRG